MDANPYQDFLFVRYSPGQSQPQAVSPAASPAASLPAWRDRQFDEGNATNSGSETCPQPSSYSHSKPIESFEPHGTRSKEDLDRAFPNDIATSCADATYTEGILTPQNPLMSNWSARNSHTASPIVDTAHESVRQCPHPSDNAYEMWPVSSETSFQGWASDEHSTFNTAGLNSSYFTPPMQGLPRRRSIHRRGGLPTLSNISGWSQATGADDLTDLMKRWRNYPPDNEGVPLSVNSHAMQSSQQHPLSSRGSVDSLAARVSQVGSSTSQGSWTSCSSNPGTSPRSTASGGEAQRNSVRQFKSRRRTTKFASFSPKGGKVKGKDKAESFFPCTFCCDSFRNKHDWSRHETSLHLQVVKWMCTPNGGAVLSEATGRSHCAYCNMLDPTPEHLSIHNHDACHAQDQRHAFSRKDHLIQHLRLTHHMDVLPLIDDWKIQEPHITSRCGFCDARLFSWEERVEHLARHFRKGLTMDSWRGEHCFEPHIADRVTNALPPYLIGLESRAPIPFSSTDPNTKDQLSQIQSSLEQSLEDREPAPSNDPSIIDTFSQGTPLISHLTTSSEQIDSTATFTDLLSLNLGRYAREQMRLGVIPTDEMFQSESRRIVYGTSDPWDHTMADNDSWLANFRSEHFGGNGHPNI